MNKCLLFLSLPLVASDPTPPSVPVKPIPIRVSSYAQRATADMSARPTVSRSTITEEGRAGETMPIEILPNTPQLPRRIKRSLMGFARSLPVEILAPGMLISFDSTTAVYKRGNRIEIRIHNNIDIDEDHSGDASE